MAVLKAHFALKALVIALGLVILVLLGAVVFGILRQAERLDQATAPMSDRGLERQAGDLTETDVAVPVGCRLADVVPDRDLLVLRLEGPAERGCQQAILVDPAAGTVVARIRLAPED